MAYSTRSCVNSELKKKKKITKNKAKKKKKGTSNVFSPSKRIGG